MNEAEGPSMECDEEADKLIDGLLKKYSSVRERRREAGRKELEAEIANLKQALDHLRRSIDGYDVAFEVASEIAGDAWSQDD